MAGEEPNQGGGQQRRNKSKQRKATNLRFFKAGPKRCYYHRLTFRFHDTVLEEEYLQYSHQQTINGTRIFYFLGFWVFVVITVSDSLAASKNAESLPVPLLGACLPILLAFCFSFSPAFVRWTNFVTFVLFLLVGACGMIAYSVVGTNRVAEFEVLIGLMTLFFAVAMFSKVSFLSGSLAAVILWLTYSIAVVLSKDSAEVLYERTEDEQGKLTYIVAKELEFWQIFRRILFLFFSVLVVSYALYNHEIFRRQTFLNFREAQNWRIDYTAIQLREKIGEGKYGEVYKCQWRGDWVALKRLSKLDKEGAREGGAPSNSPLKRNKKNLKLEKQLKEFEDEIEVMCALRHPNVVQFMGASLTRPNLCIVMEYMANGTLFDIVHDQDLPLLWHRKIAFATDAAKGMRFLHLHDPPLFHCDLKSLNLLVDENWRVKVGDFGLLTFKGMKDDDDSAAIGTLLWTAAELFRGHGYTEKCDVYSYGIVLWEIATRSVPYVRSLRAMRDSELFSKVAKGFRPKIPAWCPPNLAFLIASAFHQCPTSRPSFPSIVSQLMSLDVEAWDAQGARFQPPGSDKGKSSASARAAAAAPAVAPAAAESRDSWGVREGGEAGSPEQGAAGVWTAATASKVDNEDDAHLKHKDGLKRLMRRETDRQMWSAPQGMRADMLLSNPAVARNRVAPAVATVEPSAPMPRRGSIWDDEMQAFVEGGSPPGPDMELSHHGAHVSSFELQEPHQIQSAANPPPPGGSASSDQDLSYLRSLKAHVRAVFQ